MRPAAGTKLFFMGTEGVLFSDARQELHAFNTTACVIWCHLEDHLAPDQIAKAITGIDEAVARSHVDAALADWSAKGLLEGGSSVPMAAPQTAQAPDLPPAPEGVAAVIYRYRTLGVTVQIRFGHERHARLVHPLLAHLVREDISTPDLIVNIAQVAGGVGIYVDGIPEAFCARDDEVAPFAKGAVWSAVLRRQDYLLHIHAGVVGGRAGCVLLPAAAGSGKSTLTLALVHTGYDLFSDEVALLSPEDLTVSPFPTSICVKDSGIDVAAALYPSVRELPIHLRPDGKHVAYLPPPAHTVPPEGHRRAVSGIVFPSYRAGAPTRSRRLAPAEALSLLLTHCQSVGRNLDSESVGALVRWIEPFPCLELSYGSLASACETISEMLGDRSR
ncbi:MAG: hypothetical protein EXR07_20320 [Acetobacteraceae bacterium]|nr:hypothetical protein [Acetobacteraceae bacterium]